MRVEYPAAGWQLRITDVDGRPVTASIINSDDQPQVLDLRYWGRERYEQRIKDIKDLGFLALPHYSFAANRIWMHRVMLAGMLNTWSKLLGADSRSLAAANQTAYDMRSNGYTSRTEQSKAQRRSARSLWWLWDPRSLRARVVSTTVEMARHVRQVRVRLDGHAAHASLLAAALASIRGPDNPA